jgi:hypothetical protein
MYTVLSKWRLDQSLPCTFRTASSMAAAKYGTVGTVNPHMFARPFWSM